MDAANNCIKLAEVFLNLIKLTVIVCCDGHSCTTTTAFASWWASNFYRHRCCFEEHRMTHNSSRNHPSQRAWKFVEEYAEWNGLCLISLSFIHSALASKHSNLRWKGLTFGLKTFLRVVFVCFRGLKIMWWWNVHTGSLQFISIFYTLCEIMQGYCRFIWKTTHVYGLQRVVCGE